MWVVRDSAYGYSYPLLWLYDKEKPTHSNSQWLIPNFGTRILLDDVDFPQFENLKWEDEPLEVTLILKQ